MIHAKLLISIVFIDRFCVLYSDSSNITSNRRTCTHCREYICAFTSNYAGRGNPVRRHAASSREDQRTRRHSVLLHSLVASDAHNAIRRRDAEKKGESRRPDLEKLWARSNKHTEVLPFVSIVSPYSIEISFRHANFEMLPNQDSHLNCLEIFKLYLLDTIKMGCKWNGFAR